MYNIRTNPHVWKQKSQNGSGLSLLPFSVHVSCMGGLCVILIPDGLTSLVP